MQNIQNALKTLQWVGNPNNPNQALAPWTAEIKMKPTGKMNKKGEPLFQLYRGDKTVYKCPFTQKQWASYQSQGKSVPGSYAKKTKGPCRRRGAPKRKYHYKK